MSRGTDWIQISWAEWAAILEHLIQAFFHGRQFIGLKNMLERRNHVKGGNGSPQASAPLTLAHSMTTVDI